MYLPILVSIHKPTYLPHLFIYQSIFLELPDLPSSYLYVLSVLLICHQLWPRARPGAVLPVSALRGDAIGSQQRNRKTARLYTEAIIHSYFSTWTETMDWTLSR